MKNINRVENEFVNTYEISAIVKTPIYIGVGSMLLKKDYYIDDNEKKIYVVDVNKLIKKSQRILSKYEEFIKSNKTFNEWVRDDMTQYLNADVIKKEYCSYIVDIGDVDLRGGEKKVGGNKRDNKSNNINRFIKNSFGEPYIPGSSLKGVLRTATLSSILLEEKDTIKINKNINDIENCIKYEKGKKKDSINKLESRYFNKLGRETDKFSNAVNDIFSYISISDSDPIDITSLVLCEKIDVGIDETNNRKEKILPIVRECLKSGTEIKFTINIYKNENVYNIERIIEMIKKHSSYYLKYFNKHFNEPLTHYDGIYLPIGGGVGYISKTVVEEASKNADGAKYISTILDKQFRGKEHYDDYRKLGFAPRLEKTTKYNSSSQLMGLLELKNIFEPKTHQFILKN